MIHTRHSKGFTLIEILVVISIVSLLSSVVFASVSVARVKAIDARKVAESKQVQTALTLFYDQNNRMPGNYLASGSYSSTGGGTSIAFEDASDPNSASNQAYEASMRELVEGGFLGAIPYSPGGEPYGYYDYGPGSSAGAVFITGLSSMGDTSTGLPGSCRPFTSSPLVSIDNVYIYQFVTHATYHYEDGSICNYVHIASGPMIDPIDVDPTAVENACYNPSRNACDSSLTQEYCLCTPY